MTSMDQSSPAQDRLPVEIAVVAASLTIRAGLTHVLSEMLGVVVRQSADSIESLAASVRPQLMVLHVKGREGGRLTDDMWERLPEGCRVIALCPPDSAFDLIAAARRGVHALLTHDADTEELALAIRAAERGDLHVSEDLLSAATKDRSSRVPSPRPTLSQREIEALGWIADGLTHSQIGQRMGLTEATISTYVKRIRYKLQVGNKAELTRKAIDLGYVRSP